MMKIIGEKINGTLKSVRTAIMERNESFIIQLAQKQAEAGVDWLDVNAGTGPDREEEDLLWLVRTVQSAVTDIPLCLDSANSRALERALTETVLMPMINSISLEAKRLAGILPLCSSRPCTVIALAMDENGIPKDEEGRLSVIRRLMEITRKSGIADSAVYIDPLVMAASTNQANGLIALRTIRKTHQEFPEVHFTCGLSNISFGLPARTLVNQAFLSLALFAGLDCAILDPLDRRLRETLLATELVLGRDRHCQRYTKAFKAELIG